MKSPDCDSSKPRGLEGFLMTGAARRRPTMICRPLPFLEALVVAGNIANEDNLEQRAQRNAVAHLMSVVWRVGGVVG